MMPRTGKKDRKRRNSGQNTSSNTDVTVYDFAHVGKGEVKNGKVCRAKKSTSIHSEVKLLCGQPVEKVDLGLAWYERDLDDFDMLKLSIKITDNETSSSEDEDENSGTTRPTVDNETQSFGYECRKIYPVDFWFLLADFIYPEDVGRFAQICQHSHYVVHTTHFWRKLYYRFLPQRIYDLPLELQPCSMTNVNGLRTRVIRALYLMYKIFRDRTAKPSLPFEDEIHNLSGGRCLLMWYRKDARKDYWHFYFKIYHETTPCSMQRSKSGCRHGRNGTSSPHSSPARRPRDLLTSARNIHDNAEEGCRLLEVTAMNFIAIPIIMGQYLNNVYLNVSQGMRYHKLRLSFDSYSNSRSTRPAVNTGATDVVLDPIVDAKVYKWWHPNFRNTVEN